MAALNINRVVLTGNLTADPDLRWLQSGMAVCKLRIAVNARHKDGASGEWVDKPNYFDVTVWGAHGEKCAKYLSKGRPVAVDGRLEWREWQDKETGKNRQSIDIIADTVQFLASTERPPQREPTYDDLPQATRPRNDDAIIELSSYGSGPIIPW